MELRADKDYANLSYCTGTEYEKSGLSVRCVQDEEENSISGLSSSSVNTIITSSSVIPALNGNFLVDFRDGQTYRTVTIGEQTWMAENLKYKTDFSTCHRDIDSCAKYGRLYEWGEAMHSPLRSRRAVLLRSICRGTAEAQHTDIDDGGLQAH